VTLAEFLYPLRAKAKGEQVLAALYFLKHQMDFPQATPSRIRTDLMDAQVPRAKTANYSAVLARLVPRVHRVGSGRWEITETGEKYVRTVLGLTLDREADLAPQDVGVLAKLAAALSDDAERDYVEEAIKCLEVGARRASVVFLWAGAVHNLREKVWSQNQPPSIEAALKSHNPKARPFKKKGDFANVSDSDLLQIGQDFEIIDKNDKTMLSQALDLRNSCGHPVKYKPGEKKVSSFIEDVLQIVFEVEP